MNGSLAGILLYLAIQFAIGIWVSKRIHSEADYIIAGRSLGLTLGAFSIFATWFGAETIVGAAGEIYTRGLSGGSADPFGYVLCIFLMGLVFARPLWNRGFTTFGDLFRARYSVGVERLAVILLVPTSVIWGAAQIRAFGQVVSASSGLSLELAITAAAIFIICYTAVGGLLADAWTDLVQGIALILGLLILLAVFVWNGTLQEALPQVAPERFAILGSPGTPWYEIVESWAIPVFGSVMAIELVSRILGCKSASTARNACLIGGGIYLFVGIIPALLGLIGPILLPELAEPEQLITTLADLHLGRLAGILFSGALISGILSTVDSTLLAASALLTHNVLLQLKPELSGRAKLLCSRAGVILLGGLAYGLALTGESIEQLVEYSSSFGSSGIFVVACFALFTRIGGTVSAYSTLVTGIAVWAIGEFIVDLPAPFSLSVIVATAVYLFSCLIPTHSAVAVSEINPTS